MITGVPRKVNLDSWFPVFNYWGNLQPAFAKPAGDFDFWPLILEKAWAKIFGTQDAIIGGLQTEVFRALTQAPSKFLDLKKGSESLMHDLLEMTSNKWLGGAGTNCTGNDKDRGPLGIACHHAYGILGAYRLKVNGSQVDLIRCRNPWGMTN